MQEQQAGLFPVFKAYAWRGATADESAQVIVADSQAVSASFSADDRPALFLELAAVELTRSGILQFVERNGILGLSESFYGENGKLQLVRNDSRRNFDFEVSCLRSALSSLVALQSHSLAGDAEIRMRIELIDRINERLLGISPRLDEGMRLISTADRLVLAIWMQLAKAIDSGRQFRQCSHCERFFEVAGGTSRTDKQYCSHQCSLKAYRARKRRAVELRTAGNSLKEIAKDLGSDVKTIKGWLAEKGGK